MAGEKTKHAVHVEKQFLASSGSNIKQTSLRKKNSSFHMFPEAKDLLAESQKARRPSTDQRGELKVSLETCLPYLVSTSHMPGADQSGASQGYTIHMVKKSFNSQDVGEEQQQKKKNCAA